MSSITGVNGGVNTQTGISPLKDKSPVDIGAKDERKRSSTNKILIGAGSALAITGAVIGGLMYAKKAKFSKALNEIVGSINMSIKVNKATPELVDNFDMSNVNKELAAQIKNATETKNLDELRKIQKEYKLAWNNMFIDESRPFALQRIFQESDTDAAKALKKIFDEKGDFVEARKLYAAEFKNVHNRYFVKHSPADGKNLQETVDLYKANGFLPQGVKPHSYNAAQEMDLSVANYEAGYREVMVRKNHISEAVDCVTESYFRPYNTVPQEIKSKKFNKLVETFKDDENGVNVVTLTLPDAQGLSSNIKYSISAGNKTGELTPLQKDLIEVGGRLNEKEIQEFANLLHNQKNMDYDAILSLIQHYANDAEFMARAVQ